MVLSSARFELPDHARRSAFGKHVFAVAVVFVSMAGGFPEFIDAQPPAVDEPNAALQQLIGELRKTNNLAGLGAMVMVDGKIQHSAVDGVRVSGNKSQLTVEDRWHLGSITKSVTATMIARLVESGKMTWSDSVGESFPDAQIHDDWKPVTLGQLLTHTSGAPENFSAWVMLRHPKLGPDCTKARRNAVLNVVSEKPAQPPGQNFAYSNVGYTIAGAMAEEATGEAWEDLVKREVFEPLKLTGAGFGTPKSEGKTPQQPQGHRSVLGWKVAMGEDADNTPIMGPAGMIHMTLSDLCTYANEHLQGELGNGELLSAETYQRLHAPVLKQYACGWLKEDTLFPEIPYTVYWHNGSNTMWYALVVFIPETKMVVAVTSNDGDMEKAEAAAWEVVKASVGATGHASYPKKSPFTAVRWQEDAPEVQVNKEWFKLVSLNNLSAHEIVAFSQKTFGEQYQKRFEEDLVELLTRMGHPPQENVRLVVQSLQSGEQSVQEEVAMTEANRSAIKAAAIDRESRKTPVPPN